jgi:adenylate kinase family enzyme
MKRIAVVGSPGAGKTTFVRKLATKVHLPVIHLDYYYHQKKYDYYNDKAAWIARVKQLIRQDKWIMDGNYASTFEPRFRRADTIIFLDYPRTLSMYRALKRRIQYQGRLRSEMPTDWKEKIDGEFFAYIWRFPYESRQRIVDALQQVKGKNVVILKSPKEASEYLKQL